MKTFVKVIIFLLIANCSVAQVKDSLKMKTDTLLLRMNAVAPITDDSLHVHEKIDSNKVIMSEDEKKANQRLELLKEQEAQAELDLTKKQAEQNALDQKIAAKKKELEAAQKRLDQSGKQETKLSEQEINRLREEQNELDRQIAAKKKELEKTKSLSEKENTQQAKIAEQELERKRNEQKALDQQIAAKKKELDQAQSELEISKKQQNALSESNFKDNKKADKNTEKENARMMDSYRDSIVSTFVNVPSSSRSNENVSFSSLEKSTEEFFEKQDATASALNIEGYYFQGIAVFLEGNEKSVTKAWKQYLSETNNIKIRARKAKSLINKKKTPYYKAAEVNLSNVTDKMGDVITVFQKENGYVKMTVVYKLGYNTSLNQENFPGAYTRLKEYVQHFSQVNFQEHYEDNIKMLRKSIKSVGKEIKSEGKVLKKQQKKYKRHLKRNEADKFQELSIEVQTKLVGSLKAERNNYEFLIMEYKSRNSEIRVNQINQQ